MRVSGNNCDLPLNTGIGLHPSMKWWEIRPGLLLIATSMSQSHTEFRIFYQNQRRRMPLYCH